MKSRRIVQILGISLIVTLLFIIFPAAPILAADVITLTPTGGEVGDNIVLNGEFDATYVERFGIVYVSSSDLAVGSTQVTSAPSYERVVTAVNIPMSGYTNAGIFSCNFNIPSELGDGAVTANVTPGQYYVYVQTTVTSGGESGIMAKASLTVTAPASPTLDPLSPASGPSGTSVAVSGSNFPASTALAFQFDTTTITPTSGDTSVRSTGLFLTTINIPISATAGVHTITVTAGTATLSATFTVTGGAAITLSTASGTAGASINVTGTGFPASTALILQFDSTTLTPTSGSTATNASGGFVSTITIPSTATTGAHTITATAGTGTDSETFTVTGGGVSALTLSASTGAVGLQITISGSGFIANLTFTVTWDGVATSSTGTVDTSGVAAITYTIPAATHGSHTIGITDGTNTGTGTFTIESTPPTTPQPLRPYMDESVSAPITLDWEDVTDDSAPVTYSVQISTSANFTTDSIIINKTGITTSEYTLTDDDMLKLSTGQTYYWKECAVDAAQNQSAWTGANAFVFAQGFEFSGWIMWVTIAVAGVILFLLGIWIGRKTAYSY